MSPEKRSAIVCVIFSALLIALRCFAVPTFASMLDDFGAPLSALQRLVLGDWFLIATAIVVLALALPSAVQVARVDERKRIAMTRAGLILACVAIVLTFVSLAAPIGGPGYYDFH